MRLMRPGASVLPRPCNPARRLTNTSLFTSFFKLQVKNKMSFRYVLAFACLTGIAAADNNSVSLPLPDVLSRVTTTENTFLDELSKYKPLVETYVQFLNPGEDGSPIIGSDAYFIGNAEFRRGVDYQGFNPDKTFGSDILDFLKATKK